MYNLITFGGKYKNIQNYVMILEEKLNTVRAERHGEGMVGND